MTDAELKDCPFCDSDDIQTGGDDKVVGYWCNNCQAHGPNEYGNYTWNDRAPSPAAVTVKPLVWEKVTKNGEEGYLFSGPYEISPSGANLWIHKIEHGDIVEVPEWIRPLSGPPNGDQEPAKAAAQAHYERRILSAITPVQPATEGPEAVQEAARVLLNYLPNHAMELAALESSAKDSDGMNFYSLSELLGTVTKEQEYTVVREALTAALRALEGGE